MKPADVCIAVLVAVIWGLAFVASRIALNEFSPELMTTLRFAIAALPCLLVPRPRVSWTVLIAISFTLFLGQFLAQAFAIAHGVPVGLTSVIVQSQALFTIGFAALLFRERPSPWQTVGIAVASAGLLMICGTVGYDFSIDAFAVLMISPLSFAAGNLLLRRAQGVPMFDLFAWLCLVAAVPLFALTLVTNGPQPTWHALTHMSPDRPAVHDRPRRDIHQHRLLAVGPAAAGLPRRAGRAVRAAGAVRRLRCLERGVRRNIRAAAARRHAHGGRRYRRHAAVEASASSGKTSFAEDRVRPPMSHSLLIAFVMFATVMFFTPGPNNIMLLSSGLTYGFRPTIPHIMGITFGFAFMVGAVGLGLGTIFIAYPVLQTILKYAGAAYLIYLAAAIAMSEPVSPDQDGRGGRPMTFWGAAMFQWVNAKGWVMVIGTITAYAAIAAYPLEYRDPGRAQPDPGGAVLHGLGPVRHRRCGRS